MKKIIVTLAFVIMTNAIFAQMIMSIKKTDNSTVNMWVSDITEITFVDFICGTTTVTYSGQTYNTVLIGSQCWLKENLNVGTMIISDGSHTGFQQTNNSIIEKYCYNNNEANCDIYGGLYEWTEAMQYATTPGAQGICPSDWHIPTYAEYDTLRSYASQAAKLVAVGQPATLYTPTNETGFSALFAGFRTRDTGTFGNLGYGAYFWGSTQFSATLGNCFYLLQDYRYTLQVLSGYQDNSVRCLRD